jgi:DNA-directed RNA polymerase beta subunit
MFVFGLQDIPIVIVFRALDLVADHRILDHIVHDFNDKQMLEMLRPCLEEASPIQSKNVRDFTWLFLLRIIIRSNYRLNYHHTLILC